MRELIPEEAYMTFTNWKVTDNELVDMSDNKNMTMLNGLPVNDDGVIGESLVTSKDVFEARREGNLDRAYTMAQTLMEQPDPGPWDIRACAWCLIDLIKRANAMHEETDVELYQGELQKLAIDEADEVLFKQTLYALRIGSPAMKELSAIKQLKASGNIQEATEKAKALYVEFPDDVTVKRSYAWCLYKILQQKAKESPLNIQHVTGCLDDLFSLGLSQEVALLRCIWGTVLSIENVEGHIALYNYALQMDFDKLEECDYQVAPYVGSDGKHHEWPSLVMRVLKKSLDSLNRYVDKDIIHHLCDITEERMRSLTENTFFLQWSLAKAYLLVGEADKARDIILHLLQSKPSSFWLWNGLAETMECDHDMALSCYAKSLTHQCDLQFNGRAKLGLIQELVALGQYDVASAEIQALHAYRTKEGHKIGEALNQYMHASWYVPDSPAVDAKFYKDHSLAAAKLLNTFLPTTIGVVTYISEKAHKAFIVAEGDKLLTYHYDDAASIHEMDVVSAVYTTYERPDGTTGFQAVSCEITDQEAPSTLIKQFGEKIKAIGSGMAFTVKHNVFIDKQLVEQHQLMNGDVVSLTAIRSFNKKKNSWGWQAVDIDSIHRADDTSEDVSVI